MLHLLPVDIKSLFFNSKCCYLNWHLLSSLKKKIKDASALKSAADALNLFFSLKLFFKTNNQLKMSCGILALKHPFFCDRCADVRAASYLFFGHAVENYRVGTNNKRNGCIQIPWFIFSLKTF